jgi:5S rRNA maturation endonuclease (ribonuclease M5)
VERPGYLNIDDLQAQTTLEEAAAKCGVRIEPQGRGDNLRLDCPFGCPGDHAGKGELSINVANPQKVFCCHAYMCNQFRGNLLTLMHGWLTGTRPTGDKLKGAEFAQVRNVLIGQGTPLPSGAHAPDPRPPTTALAAAPIRNVPLVDSSNEKVRELVAIDEKFVVDVARMSPTAASYVRRHPCLSPASMKKWRVGYMPLDGGGDKRGWSLKGHILYPILSESGQVLAWVGRDAQFEQKEEAFSHLSPEQRKKEKTPAKYRFPTDFHRSQELFGQHASRLKEPGYREAILSHGIVVVEGFNDVIALDELHVPAVAICSNKITEGQVAKVEQWARQLANGKVSLLFDADEAGDNGAREALWLLAQRGLDVRLGWSQAMHNGVFQGKQPEHLTSMEWEAAIRPMIAR